MLLVWCMRYEAHALDEQHSAAVDRQGDPINKCTVCLGSGLLVQVSNAIAALSPTTMV
jgi:hypothetical protein